MRQVFRFIEFSHLRERLLLATNQQEAVCNTGKYHSQMKHGLPLTLQPPPWF